jgi:glycosyltransferase involved in cell wall biosynthesis
VVTATYNHENYLEECINSVAAQECDYPIEHIIGDDASSDRTVEIIGDYASKYRHIRAVLQKERTYGRGNTQAVLSAVNSPYVALCDGDDYFLDTRKLQKQSMELDKRPEVALCAHPVEVLNQESQQKKIFPDIRFLSPYLFMKGRTIFAMKDILKRNFIQTNSVMYRWRFVDGIPGWFNYYVAPLDWYLHILHAETGKILYQYETMSVYRLHSKGIWATAQIDPIAHVAKWANSMLRFCQVLNRHYNDQYHSILYKVASTYYSYMYRYYIDKDPKMICYYENMYPEFALAYARRYKWGWCLEEKFKSIVIKLIKKLNNLY